MTRQELAQYFSNVTMKLEGGYVNNPNDAGGATKYGVTLATLQGYRKGKKVTSADVANLTKEEAFLIIRDFMIKDYMLDYTPEVAFQILDWNWGAGPCSGIPVAKGLADTALGARDLNPMFLPLMLVMLKANHYRTSSYYIWTKEKGSTSAGNSIFYRGWMKKNLQAGLRVFSGVTLNPDYFLSSFDFTYTDSK